MPAEDRDPPLLETVMTTIAPDGTVNCAAMGVRWGESEVAFWPFATTRTLRNLRDHGEAVAHLTDDVLLFVQAALGSPSPVTAPARVVRGAVIAGASAWRELVVKEIIAETDGPPRMRVWASVVAERAGGGGDGVGSAVTPPPGLCRARHAVVEASILASRLRWLGAERVRTGLDELAELVEKTAGVNERAAMAYVRRHVAERT